MFKQPLFLKAFYAFQNYEIPQKQSTQINSNKFIDKTIQKIPKYQKNNHSKTFAFFSSFAKSHSKEIKQTKKPKHQQIRR